MLRLNHTETGFDPDTMWARSQLMANLNALAADGQLRVGGAVKVFGNAKIDGLA